MQEIWAAFAHQMVLKEVRSRAGILGFTRQIAVDYATRGIRVNAVSPGPVTTDLGRTSVENEPDFPPLGPAGSVRPLLPCLCSLKDEAEQGWALCCTHPALLPNPWQTVCQKTG